MKKVLIMGIISILTGLFGCSGSAEKGGVQSGTSTTEPVATSNDKEEKVEAVETEAAPAVEYHLEEETKFHYMFQRAETKAEYERAAKLVESELGVTGELEGASLRFGGWFILQYKAAKQDPDMIALDAPIPSKPAYVVDLVNGKVVGKEAFKAADALFKRLIEVMDSSDMDEEDREGMIDNTASIISAIAFGVAECEGHSESDNTEPPKMTKEGDIITIEYSLDVGGGESIAYKHCVLTINGEDYSFTSEF